MTTDRTPPTPGPRAQCAFVHIYRERPQDDVRCDGKRQSDSVFCKDHRVAGHFARVPGPLTRLASPELIEAALLDRVEEYRSIEEWSAWEKRNHNDAKAAVLQKELKAMDKSLPGIAALAEAAARQEVT